MTDTIVDEWSIMYCQSLLSSLFALRLHSQQHGLMAKGALHSTGPQHLCLYSTTQTLHDIGSL